MSKKITARSLYGVNWTLWQNDDGTNSFDNIKLALLMEIRDELKRMNAVLQCPNFIEVPSILRQIRKNTAKRKKPAVKGKPQLRVVARS